jgi:hypothetical protein
MEDFVNVYLDKDDHDSTASVVANTKHDFYGEWFNNGTSSHQRHAFSSQC